MLVWATEDIGINGLFMTFECIQVVCLHSGSISSPVWVGKIFYQNTQCELKGNNVEMSHLCSQMFLVFIHVLVFKYCGCATCKSRVECS